MFEVVNYDKKGYLNAENKSVESDELDYEKRKIIKANDKDENQIKRIKIVVRGKNFLKIKDEVKSINKRPGKFTDSGKIYIDFGMSKSLKNCRRSELVTLDETPFEIVTDCAEFAEKTGVSERVKRRGRPKKTFKSSNAVIAGEVSGENNQNRYNIVFNEGTENEKVVDIKKIPYLNNIGEEVDKVIVTFDDLLKEAAKELDAKSKIEARRKLNCEIEKNKIRLADAILAVYGEEEELNEDQRLNALDGEKLGLKALWKENPSAFGGHLSKIRQDERKTEKSKNGYGEYDLYFSPRLKPEERMRIISRHEAKLRAAENERQRMEREQEKERKRLAAKRAAENERREELKRLNLQDLEDILNACKKSVAALEQLKKRIHKNIMAEEEKTAAVRMALLFDAEMDSLSWYGKELENKELSRCTELKKDIILIADCSGRDTEYNAKMLESVKDIETTQIGRERNTIIVVGNKSNVRAYITSKKISVYLEQLRQESVAGLIIA